MTVPDFSIITPSFNMLAYLRSCSASVRDQEGVTNEHIIVDGASTDGTPSWLVESFGAGLSEPDHGMYDAINKGLDRCKGDIIGQLNCDEQYLPGTLSFVRNLFHEEPETDILFGDTLLVSPAGEPLAQRKSYCPDWRLIAASHMYLHTSSLFYRRRVIDEGLRFDTRFRVGGDMDFCIRMLRSARRARRCRRHFSAFAMTGNNLGANTRAEEWKLVRSSVPSWVNAVSPILNGIRLLIKTAAGAYRRSDVEYDIYVPLGDGGQREHFSAPALSTAWPRQIDPINPEMVEA